jgi:hypothetical protein
MRLAAKLWTRPEAVRPATFATGINENPAARSPSATGFREPVAGYVKSPGSIDITAGRSGRSSRFFGIDLLGHDASPTCALCQVAARRLQAVGRGARREKQCERPVVS